MTFGWEEECRRSIETDWEEEYRLDKKKIMLQCTKINGDRCMTAMRFRFSQD